MQRVTPFTRSLVLALALLGFTPVLSAQNAATPATAGATAGANTPDFTPTFPQGIWELSHENDWFIHTDRDFSSGLRLAYTTPNYRNWEQVPLVPVGLGNLFNNLSFIDSEWAVVAGGAYAQINMYTPDNLKINPPNPLDHPYASWVGVGLDLIRQTGERRAIFETNIGFVGPESGARDLQESFHSLIKSTDPKGWNSQLKNEPVLQLTYRQDWRVPGLTNYNASVRQTYGYDVLAHGLVTVGNGWDYAAAGAMARVGYNLPLDFGPSRMRFGEIASKPFQPGGSLTGSEANYSMDELSVYFCFGTEGRAVARDISLNGNTWAKSAHVTQEPFVAETYGGLVLEWGHFRGSFLIINETKTFRNQTQPDQWRGALTLGCSF